MSAPHPGRRPRAPRPAPRRGSFSSDISSRAATTNRLEQSRDGLRADVDAEPAEFVGELGGRAACPLQAADGVPGRLVGHQGFDAGDDFGRFFSVGGRPPPARRTRSTSTSRSTSCRRPVATVDGSMPRREAMLRSPPHPHLSASSPANSRRWRSSEETGEQHDGGAQLLGHQVGVGQGPPESGSGHQQPSGAELMGLLRVVGGPPDGL